MLSKVRKEFIKEQLAAKGASISMSLTLCNLGFNIGLRSETLIVTNQIIYKVFMDYLRSVLYSPPTRFGDPCKTDRLRPRW
jgi:hypothetical protein